jgi:hypothetical protein
MTWGKTVTLYGKNGDALRGKTVTLYVMTLSKHDLGKNGDALRNDLIQT